MTPGIRNFCLSALTASLSLAVFAAWGGEIKGSASVPEPPGPVRRFNWPAAAASKRCRWRTRRAWSWIFQNPRACAVSSCRLLPVGDLGAHRSAGAWHVPCGVRTGNAGDPAETADADAGQRVDIGDRMARRSDAGGGLRSGCGCTDGSPGAAPAQCTGRSGTRDCSLGRICATCLVGAAASAVDAAACPVCAGIGDAHCHSGPGTDHHRHWCADTSACHLRDHRCASADWRCRQHAEPCRRGRRCRTVWRSGGGQ